MSVIVPQAVHDRIANSEYPACKRCGGEGVIYPTNPHRTLHEPAPYVEDDCTLCYGTGYRVPITDVQLQPAYPMRKPHLS